MCQHPLPMLRELCPRSQVLIVSTSCFEGAKLWGSPATSAAGSSILTSLVEPISPACSQSWFVSRRTSGLGNMPRAGAAEMHTHCPLLPGTKQQLRLFRSPNEFPRWFHFTDLGAPGRVWMTSTVAALALRWDLARSPAKLGHTGLFLA